MYISAEPIDLNTFLARAHHEKAGAIVLFSGEVRNHHQGKSVSRLEYEAYGPMAEKMIKDILEDAKARFELHFADACHRVGPVDIKESAVVVVTSSSHRDEAYAANRHIIDRIKFEVPIWKKEHFADGTFIWVEQCSHSRAKQTV